MIRILHTADWHLGQTFFGYDRTEEHEAFLDWLAGEILRQEIDALIIAGQPVQKDFMFTGTVIPEESLPQMPVGSM